MTTVVLGLDGGCFELVQPWIDEGILPNFSTLIRDGVAEDMQSCLPPVTCPNWQCYATGANPGKLGVFWWEGIDREGHTIENRSAAGDFDGTHYWNLLNGSVAVINLPTSYPPSRVDGIHVAGGPGAEQTGYTSPESLETTLENRFDYAVHPEGLSLLAKDDPDNECTEEILDLIGMRFDVLEDVLRGGEYELVHLTVFYLNVLQHFFWDMDVVRRAWETIDKRVGRLLTMDELDNLLVMSDHGSNEIRTTFRINTWLERHGYLHTTSGVSDYLHRLGITRERVRPVLARLGIEWWARRLLPEGVQMLLPDAEGSVDMSGKATLVDWDRSRALASGQGPVYVLAEDQEEREDIASQLLADLDGLTDENGNQVFDRVLLGAEVYTGRHVTEGPDIVLDQAAGVHIEGGIGATDVFGTPTKWRAENKTPGMFIAYGPDVDGDADLQEMHILDLAPTILHLHGVAVSERMDGQVRRDLFTPDSEPATREISWSERAESEAIGGEASPRDVTERLSDLGYLE